MRSDAELTGGSQQIVPHAGAIARVNFATISGKAVPIREDAGWRHTANGR